MMYLYHLTRCILVYAIREGRILCILRRSARLHLGTAMQLKFPGYHINVVIIDHVNTYAIPCFLLFLFILRQQHNMVVCQHTSTLFILYFYLTRPNTTHTCYLNCRHVTSSAKHYVVVVVVVVFVVDVVVLVWYTLMVFLYMS